MKRIVAVVFAMVFIVCSAMTALGADPGGIQFKEMAAEEVRKEMASGNKVMLIDARSDEEYAEGHIPGAVNIGPDKFTFISGYLPQDKDFPLIFYCRGTG